MEWLNYHHLRYFWTVVREGSVSKAAVRLRLSQPTVSAQLRMLEDALGERLFDRRGRTLVLTDVGRIAYGYADEIFGLGRELTEAVRGRPGRRPRPLTVGVANAVPKLIVYRLLRPATSGGQVHLVCREGNADQLVAQLATHALDVVIAETPAPPHVRVKVFNHPLGESPVTFFARPPLAARLKRRFPASLEGAPLLLPTVNTALRRSLDLWFDARSIRPTIVGEFEDSALMKVFGEAMDVAFPAPAVIEREVRRYYGVQVTGRTPVTERYYAITAERRLTHPGVLSLTSAARADLFA